MQLTCPWCGPRDVEEFVFGGDAAVIRPKHDDPSLAAWRAYLYERDNPCGLHREFWHHEAGCRQWLIVTRDTASHEILSFDLAKKELS